MDKITPTRKRITSVFDLWALFEDGESYSRDLVTIVFNYMHPPREQLDDNCVRVDLGDGRVIKIADEFDSRCMSGCCL